MVRITLNTEQLASERGNATCSRSGLAQDGSRAMTRETPRGETRLADLQGTLKGGNRKVSRSIGILLDSEHKAKSPAASQEGTPVG